MCTLFLFITSKKHLTTLSLTKRKIYGILISEGYGTFILSERCLQAIYFANIFLLSSDHICPTDRTSIKTKTKKRSKLITKKIL